jgi:PPOX class probable F420-dependent enzyme
MTLLSLTVVCSKRMTLDRLPGWAQDLIAAEPVARLGLLDDNGRPRVLPITFVAFEGAVWSAIDHKPKRSRGDPARVRFLRRRPQSTVTVDHYEDDWTQLAWVQLLGHTAVLETAGHEAAVAALCRRYPAYRERPPQGPLLRLVPERALHWRASGAG